jgi:dipeptidyl aminopeptidase/acylaminoacyl peptidase
MTNLWAIREKGGLYSKPNREPVQLTTGPMSVYAPVPSADGKRLFVVGAQARGELVRYDAGSGHFVPHLSGISVEHLDISRDREWMVYVAYPEATLWRSKVDGSQRLQLSSPPMQAAMPRWSPDGKRIAFYGFTPGRPSKIYLVSAEGGTLHQLMPGERTEADPEWSPDGNSLVFCRLPWFEAEAAGPVAIHLVDLRTNQVTTLPGSEGLFSPRWSPDGRYVVAMTATFDKFLLFDFTTQKWTELANMGAGYPSWSRDGRYVYFRVASEEEQAIYRVQISDRKLERVVKLENLRWERGIMGQWFGLARDDSPLLLRSPGTQEIYALDWEAP